MNKLYNISNIIYKMSNELIQKIVTYPIDQVPLNEFKTVATSPETYKQHLHQELVNFYDNIDKVDSEQYKISFLLLLIGQTQCKESFSILCNILKKFTLEQVNNFFGDFLVYDYPSVLSATYNDHADFNMLCEIMLNPNLPYGSRSCVLLCMKILVKEGTLNNDLLNTFMTSTLLTLTEDPVKLISEYNSDTSQSNTKLKDYHTMTLFMLDVCVYAKLESTIPAWEKLHENDILSKLVTKSFDDVKAMFQTDKLQQNLFASSSTVDSYTALKKYDRYTTFFKKQEEISKRQEQILKHKKKIDYMKAQIEKAKLKQKK